jgi:DNA-binding MarR family transcriptional regulator
MKLLNLFRKNAEERKIARERPPVDPYLSSRSEILRSLSKRLKRMDQVLVEHDRFVRSKVARQATVEVLLDSLQALLPTASEPQLDRIQEHLSRIERQIQVLKPSRTSAINTDSRRRQLSENQKRILAILASDPSESFTYSQLADMTRLSPDGVRSMISQLGRTGYRFKKRKEGRKTRVQVDPTRFTRLPEARD